MSKDKNACNKEMYYRYKSLGVCVKCHCDDAMIGKVLCPECADKVSARDRARYEKQKQDETSFQAKRIAHNEYRKERRRRYAEEGLCSECGKRPPMKGYKYCLDCHAADRRKRHERELKKNPIRRVERSAYGMCWFCGKPNKEGMKVCEGCHARMVGMTKNREANPTAGLYEGREKWKKWCNRYVFGGGARKTGPAIGAESMVAER